MGKCHDLEKFSAATVDLNLKYLLADKERPKKITSLYLVSEQGRAEVCGICLNYEDDVYEIAHRDYPATTMPFDSEDDDPYLAPFQKKHPDLDVGWGDYGGLPESFYRMEMIKAAHLVAEKAKKKGVAIAAKAKVGIMIEDEIETNPKSFFMTARDRLAELGPLAVELLSIYYKDPSKTGLIKAKKSKPAKEKKKKK